MFKLYLSHYKFSLSLIFLCLFLTGLAAQNDKIAFTNSKPVDDKRYSDIKGSPMYFKDWVTGKIIRHDALIYEDVLLNYNGYTRTFEIKTGDEMIELDGDVYLRVDVDAADNPDAIDRIPTEHFAFQKNLHSRFSDQFVIILFAENDVMLIKEFKVDIAKHTIQDVGKAIDFKDFQRKEIYYLKADGKLTSLRYKKKVILGAFDSPEVEPYIKEHKLRLKTEADLIQLAQFYSTLD